MQQLKKKKNKEMMKNLLFTSLMKLLQVNKNASNADFT